ncbi:DedA family protein [Dietzia cinnamea]|uniref:DedA family protein n=1 Tax=Dietzia cinnamea TaxID=321318 RepID=UPI00223ABE66|nr:DedA family protein [Dietzia cinnamea]MCT2060576.1 DedA family protein [Dietzia cinnamea]MCT2236505.1 DedA family protein [Dietzia cinnamea]MCT2300685.1 DedA family protein [Dietzia cinnamea]
MMVLAASPPTDPSAGYDGFIGWILSLMETLGELGVGIAILLETFLPPIPSEAVLPGAGFLAYDGRMSFWLAWVAATAGALLGAWIWYVVGAALGRDRTRRLVGRIPLLDHDDFDKSEAFFQKWGGVAVLVGRCVPLVRSFISIPAGIERMPFAHFSAYTLLGSGVWNAIWIGAGYLFGPAIKPALEQWSGMLSNAVLAVIAIAFVWFVVKRVRRLSRTAIAEKNSVGSDH